MYIAAGYLGISPYIARLLHIQYCIAHFRVGYCSWSDSVPTVSRIFCSYCNNIIQYVAYCFHIDITRPTQYTHPWQHGHGHTKATAFFLKNLPPLVPSKLVTGRSNALAKLRPAEDRASRRSKTYTGIAAAMATQWMPTLHQYTEAPATKRNGDTRVA